MPVHHPGSGLQVMVNEEVDPALVIKRLKQEIRDLRDEIRLMHACTCCAASCELPNLSHPSSTVCKGRGKGVYKGVSTV